MKKSIYFFFLIILMLSPLIAQTWSPIKRLTWHAGGSRIPSIAASSLSGTHIVWHDTFSGSDEIYYTGSIDGGTTWSGRKRLTWNSGQSYWPNIATDIGGAIHLVWYDDTPGNYEIFYKHSTDGGANWSASNRLTWNSGDSRWPSIATSSGNSIHVVWPDDTSGSREIYYKHSTDSGTTWSGLKRLTWSTSTSMNPYIATDSIGMIHVVWWDQLGGNGEIFYKRSTDGGITWSGRQRLTWNAGNSVNPCLAVTPTSVIHVVWMDDPAGNKEIYYKHSTDGGTTWSGPKRLTWNSGESHWPHIASDLGGAIHLVWHDDTPGNHEIFYKRSSNSGVTWSALNRLTWNAGVSEFPDIAVKSANSIHVVWEDDSPGNKEIYYKNRIIVKTK